MRPGGQPGHIDDRLVDGKRVPKARRRWHSGGEIVKAPTTGRDHRRRAGRKAEARSPDGATPFLNQPPRCTKAISQDAMHRPKRRPGSGSTQKGHGRADLRRKPQGVSRPMPSLEALSKSKPLKEVLMQSR